jgi:hypothetical protein
VKYQLDLQLVHDARKKMTGANAHNVIVLITKYQNSVEASNHHLKAAERYEEQLRSLVSHA